MTILPVLLLIAFSSLIDGMCYLESYDSCCTDGEMLQTCANSEKLIDNYASLVIMSTQEYELNLYTPLLNCEQYTSCCAAHISCQSTTTNALCIKARNALITFNTIVETKYNITIPEKVKEGEPKFVCDDTSKGNKHFDCADLCAWMSLFSLLIILLNK